VDLFIPTSASINPTGLTTMLIIGHDHQPAASSQRISLKLTFQEGHQFSCPWNARSFVAFY